MTGNRNETPVFGLSREQLDGMFARTTAGLVSDREARRRAAEWPGQVNDLLATLVRTLAAHEDRIAALEARLGHGRG